MRLVFDYAIRNETSSPIGPFDLTSIFGPYKRDQDMLMVPANETATFKTTLSDPLDITELKFNRRLAALGLSREDSYFLVMSTGAPHEDDVAALQEIRKTYKPVPPLGATLPESQKDGVAKEPSSG